MKRVAKHVTGSEQLEGRLLDYIDSDDLHRVMSYNPNFKPLTAYRPGEGMVIITQNDKEVSGIGPYGAVDSTFRYFMFYQTDSGTWEAVEVDNDTTCKIVGQPFSVDL